MEVILLDDVERVGHEGDIVRVADGYARNYLMPRGLAVVADRPNRKQLDRRRNAIERREVEKAAVATRHAEDLRGRELTIAARGGESGKLHGSVTTQHIAVALKEQHGLDVDRRRIELPETIRSVGDYLVSIQMYKGVTAEIPVKVTIAVPEGEEAMAEEAEAPEEDGTEEDATEEAATEEPEEAEGAEDATS